MTRKKTDDEEDAEPPVAVKLVEHALSQYELGISESGEPFAVSRDKPHLAKMLRSSKPGGLRTELAAWFFREHNKVPASAALTDAMSVLEGTAAQRPTTKLHLRVADHDGHIYIDSGDPEGTVYIIGGGRWKIGTPPPGVVFRRTQLTGVMATPSATPNINALWKFCNIDALDRTMLVAWLVHAIIRPESAHAILSLAAEQGSAKSTLTRFLVSLIDPSPVELRKPPKDAESWVVAAYASWTVAIDNMTGTVPEWLAASLCRACTGEGDVKRALYTDNDVSVIALRRNIVINGIDLQVAQGDLGDRQLPIRLPRISGNRKTDDQVRSEWAAVRPDVFAGLLGIAAKVHRALPDTRIANLPRLADYGLILAATDHILKTEAYDKFLEQIVRTAADTLEGSFIEAILKANYACDKLSAAEILTALTPTSKEWHPPKTWPTTARSVTAQLTRHAPALRTQGWSIDNDNAANQDNRVKWTITPPDGVPPHADLSGKKAVFNSLTRDDTQTPSSEPIRAGELNEPHELSDPPHELSDELDELSHELEKRDNSSRNIPLSCEHELTSQTSQESGKNLAPPGEATLFDLAEFKPPTGPGRCAACGHHVSKQGHRANCTAA